MQLLTKAGTAAALLVWACGILSYSGARVLRQVVASTPRFTVSQTHAQEAEAFIDAMM